MASLKSSRLWASSFGLTKRLEFVRPFLAMASLKACQLWRCSFGLTKRLDFIRPFLAMASLKSSRLWRCSFGLTKRFPSEVAKHAANTFEDKPAFHRLPLPIGRNLSNSNLLFWIHEEKLTYGSRSYCLEPLPPKSFFCSRSKFSRKCISTGESSFLVRSLNLSYSLSAFSFANFAEILPA